MPGTSFQYYMKKHAKVKADKNLVYRWELAIWWAIWRVQTAQKGGWKWQSFFLHSGLLVADYENDDENEWYLVKEALCRDRIVLVSSVSLMKEVFNLKVTVERPEMIFTTTRNRVMTNGRTSEIGEPFFPWCVTLWGFFLYLSWSFCFQP